MHWGSLVLLKSLVKNMEKGRKKRSKRKVEESLVGMLTDLDGDAGVDLLELALARIREVELDLLPSWGCCGVVCLFG